MTNELTIQQQNSIVQSKWNRDQIELIKRTICKGASDDQLLLFEYVCHKTGLDPFIKQIYGIIRMVADKKTGEKNPHMTIQTSIDGLRLIADRTGNYMPGRKPTHKYDANGRLVSSTSYIKKYAKGEWHEIEAEAIYSEYKPAYDNDFWTNKPHIMLPKCAEALALRKAFPAEMCGIYTKEEMDQAEDNTINIRAEKTDPKPIPVPQIEDRQHENVKIETITEDQATELGNYLSECDPIFISSVYNFVKISTNGQETSINFLPAKHYEKTLEKAKANREEYIKKQMAEVVQ